MLILIFGSRLVIRCAKIDIYVDIFIDYTIKEFKLHVVSCVIVLRKPRCWEHLMKGYSVLQMCPFVTDSTGAFHSTVLKFRVLHVTSETVFFGSLDHEHVNITRFLVSPVSQTRTGYNLCFLNSFEFHFPSTSLLFFISRYEWSCMCFRPS